jgi:predicted PurR-regulated permease PerM
VAWTARRILLAILTILGVAALFVLLYRFYMVVFLFFIAFSLKVAFDPAISWLQRRGVRRQVSMIVLYTLLASALMLLVWIVVPPLVEQSRTVAGQLPALYSEVRSTLITQPVGLVRGLGRVLPAELSLPQLAALAASGEAAAESDPWAMPLTAVGIAFAFVSVFVMAYFWTLEDDLIIRRFLLRAPAGRRAEIRTMIADVQGKIDGYFRGQIILCGSIGVLSAVAFFAIGVPNALLLALLMAIFEAVPVVGPVLGAIPAVLMAASTAPDKVPWVIGAVIVIQVAESNLLVPKVMDKAVGVNAIVSMLAIAAFGALFGVAGALLAVPLAAVLQILLTRLLFEAPTSGRSAALAGSSSQPQRHRLALLQLQTQDLAQDARKLARISDEQHDRKTELLIDELETIANRLDTYLANQEYRS